MKNLSVNLEFLGNITEEDAKKIKALNWYFVDIIQNALDNNDIEWDNWTFMIKVPKK